MLAPAFETALDPVCAEHFELLRAARDAWPELIATLDQPPDTLDRSGALHVGLADDAVGLADLHAQLQSIGAVSEPLDAAALRRWLPGLSPNWVGGVFTPEDWRLDPLALLAALEAAFDRWGGRRVASTVSLNPNGQFFADGQAISADALVVAAGPGALGWSDLIPELAALHPIKGQILTFEAPPRGGPVVRGPSAYVAPQSGGAMVGATMEAGRIDLAIDAATVERLRASAIDLFPALATAPLRASAGVRVATADGLPLVGASQVPGVYLAVGARRNGWLLAPLMAGILLDAIAGRSPTYGAQLRPTRFSP
jgi:glycine oxidase